MILHAYIPGLYAIHLWPLPPSLSFPFFHLLAPELYFLIVNIETCPFPSHGYKPGRLFITQTSLPPAAREALICLHLIPITPSLGPALPAPNSVMCLVVRAQP